MRAPRQPIVSPRRSQSRTLTARQTELLDRLEELFLSEGFAHLTLDDIVSELRCSKMTLYTLAPSREQLTLTVLRRFFDKSLKEIDNQLHQTRSPDAQIPVCLTATLEQMHQMTPTCFNDVMQFGTTREIYETFSAACSNRLTQLLAVSLGSAKVDMARIAFVTEMVRVVFEDMHSGEFTDRTGLDNDLALDHLIKVIRGSLAMPRPRAATQIKRLKEPSEGSKRRLSAQ
jgi:AcrR family transcriptional regulator